MCVLGGGDRPLAGYCRVLLPLFSPVHEGCSKVGLMAVASELGAGGLCW